MKLIKRFLMQTSTQIALSSLTIMLLIFTLIAIGIYQQLASYILEQSVSTIDAMITQTQERLDSALREIDTNIQQFCNDATVEEILYQANEKGIFSAQNFASLRRQVMYTLNYADSLENFEVYTEGKMIYPYTMSSIQNVLSEEELNLVDQQNGKIVWLSNSSDHQHTIRAAKRILLPDYNFCHGGYLVFTPKSDFLNFFEEDFQELNGIFLTLKDRAGQQIYQYTNVPNLTEDTLQTEAFRSISSVSPYSQWNLTFYVSKNLQKQDIPWLVKILAIAFGIGGFLFLLCCILISHILCAPLRDMEKAMILTDTRLQINPKHYANSDVNKLNLHYNRLVKANNRLIDEVYEKELLRTKAEIEALQAQVNPHFIINALESMYWVLVQKGDMETSKVLLSLAHLFRYILKGKDWISLDEELHFIEQYLQIEKFRFGSKLKWSYAITENLKNIKIPKLLIHPLVENSVKYAVETTTKDVHVTIEVHGTLTDYEIIVTDDGAGIDQPTLNKLYLSFQDKNPVGSVSSSYGLANLYKRIHIYFGQQSSLKITTIPEIQGTSVKLRIRT